MIERQKILFVSHCILNTASKVARSTSVSRSGEDQARLELLRYALEYNIGLVQLPCMEFTLYGAARWGHTKEQFDNPFFRDACYEALRPIVQQMRAYLQTEMRDRFDVLGIVGINGSPSCGVSRTCVGPWGGEFSGRTDLPETLAKVSGVPGSGVMIEVLREMLEESGISLPIVGLDAHNPAPLRNLLQGKPSE